MATTIAPEGQPPEVVNARRTESIDASAILNLVQQSTNSLFGRVNIVNIIEKAVLAVTLVNEKDEILGHAAFFDYPNVDTVDQADWQEWMNGFYDTKKCTPLNSLFMHYFVAKPEYANGCAREIVRTAFNAVPDVHFLFLGVPIGTFPDVSLAELFKPLDRIGERSPVECAMFCCNRHDHVPVVHVRQARVEDHDDLTPIFNRQSDMLKMTYGDFFLAELIEAQDEHMHCLISEVDGTAYGFLSISEDVNYDLLNDCFELGAFHGLRKPHPDDIVEAPKTPSPSPPPDQERPPSRESAKSAVSAGKGEGDERKESIKESTKESSNMSPPKSEEKKESSGSKQSSGRSSRVNSNASDVDIKQKLSEAHMVEASGSRLSQDGDDQEAASGKSTPLMDDSPKPPTPVSGITKKFIPTYNGEPNAFSIQLFCIDERYEMRSSDFLGKAFAQFPDKDFCIVTVPHLVPEFPLLQSFVRVTPRTQSMLSQELYVFHRNGLLKDFTVRPACTKDYSGVEKLVKTIHLHENLLKDLSQYNKARRDEDGTEIQAFVAESQLVVVGVAIVRREEDIEYIRSHYNIEDFIYYNHHRRIDHGHLHHYALNPMFSHLSKHFLKEILRLGHKTCLYYPLYPSYTDKEVVERHSLVCSLKEMVPVRHRKQIAYPTEKLGINAPSDRVLTEREPYALNHINRKLTLEPKVTVNARIVVVGASDVGIGFLEALAYCPHLHFNNLTLVSPHGLPGEMQKDEQRDQMLSTHGCYSHEEHAKVALNAWVNVVYGKMTAVDRKKKLVVVNNGNAVPYDHLVLSTGLQYQLPMPTDADIDAGTTNSTVPNKADRRFSGVKPKNLFLVNDTYDSAVALYWIENKLAKSSRKTVVYGSSLDAYCCIQMLLSMGLSGKTVVYGSSLDAYCCVQMLLSMGLSGDKIVMIHPPTQYETSCFNNPFIEEAMTTEFENKGIRIYKDMLVAQWNDGADCTEIKWLTFTSNDQPLRLECSGFFSYYRKAVDYEAFRAINDACLVYDGKLVIDAYFHTNDVSIRGAGPLTKFQRKYHAEKWSHCNFNSKEVGVHLATEMLRLFDPTLENQPSPNEEELNLIPIYRNPKIQAASLPGGFHYLHVAKSGLDKPLIEQMGEADYGREITTGHPGGEREYFRLHLNQYNNVETITCLSKKPISTTNLVCLFGIHERCLNNLVSRFDEGLIKDLYEFFNETWALALYHDRFADFREELRELLTSRPNDGSDSLEERVRQIVDPELPLSDSQRGELVELYKKSGAKRAVEARLLNFLSYNYYHLPMYAKPGMV